MALIDWLSGRPASRLCMLSYDFSLDVLAALEGPALVRLFRCMEEIAGADPAFARALRSIGGSVTPDGILTITDQFLAASKAFTELGLVPFIAAHAKKAEATFARIRGEPWCRSTWICDPDLTGIYGDLVSSFNNYAAVARLHPQQFGQFWLHAQTITLGPPEPFDFDANDPMNVATRKLADDGHLVIVSAGNAHGVVTGRTMNPWALAPWVLGVGATDEMGTALLSTSSRGTPSDPRGPSVVAPGVERDWSAALDHGNAVAFAQVRNAAAPASVTQYLKDGFITYKKHTDGAVTVHLNRAGSETFLPADRLRELLGATSASVTGTSFAAHYVAAVSQSLALKVRATGVEIPRAERPKLIRQLLSEFARPLPDRAPFEQGFGVITWPAAQVFIDSLTADHVVNSARAAKDLW